MAQLRRQRFQSSTFAGCHENLRFDQNHWAFWTLGLGLSDQEILKKACLINRDH